ncbi:MAG: periplasmic heavy metal sensor [Pseudomonadota bacterium]
MTNVPETPAPKPWRWGRIALILSLGLNLVIVGVIAGVLLSPPDKGPKRDRQIDWVSMGLGPYIRALPDEARASVIEAAGGLDRKARRKTIKEIRKGRKVIAAMIAAPEFTPDDLKAALEKQRQTAVSRSVAMHDAFYEVIVAMSAEDRAALVERAKKYRKKKHKDK